MNKDFFNHIEALSGDNAAKPTSSMQKIVASYWFDMGQQSISEKLQAERDKSQQLARDKGDMRIEIQDLKRKIEATLAYQELLLDAQEEMEKKLQAEREKVALLKEAVGDLIHHFNDYGMESEAIACLMAVKKARQTLEKLK